MGAEPGVQNPSDAVLAERCLAGNTAAFNDLIHRHQNAVFGFVLKMTGNWHEAADLTQDTFLRAYRSWIPTTLVRHSTTGSSAPRPT